MDKEMISTKQGIFMVVMLFLGTSIIISGGGKAKQDIWISTLLAIAFSIPLLLIYGKIVIMFPQKNLFQILEILFGKVFGSIISIFYIFYFLHLGAIGIRNITEFIQVVSFPETPQYFSAIWIGVLLVFMVKSGIEVLGRWSNFILFFILSMIILLSILSIPKFDFTQIRPILYEGWGPVFFSTFSLFSFPFAESVVFLSIFHTLKEYKKSYKVYLIGLLIGAFFLLITSIRNILLLGFPNMSITIFPSYYATSIISIGTFLQRIETIASIILLLCGFAKVCICLFAVCIGVTNLFEFPSYKDLAVPLSLLMLTLSMILYKNTMEMVEFVEVYKYYALPFQVFFPILILIVGMIRKKNNGQLTIIKP